MKQHFHRLVALLVVVVPLAIVGCGGSSSTTPEPMPEPAPMPDPGPTDLEQTQADAAAAAAAAMTASDAASASAMSAADATADIATLQTNGMAASYAKMAQMAAAAAMAAYETAKGAAASAESATDSPAAEDARGAALLAQATAEAEAMKAADAAMKAAEAAMTELHIDGMMYMVGDGDEKSSIDTSMGKLSTPAAVSTDPDIVTGLQNNVMREDSGEVKGQAHSLPGVTPVVPYKQAVAARDLAIGKTLDTTDDMARVTVIHSRAGSKMVRVYANDGVNTGAIVITTTDAGAKSATEGGTDLGTGTAAWVPELKSVGMFYEATETAPTDDPATTVDESTLGTDATGLNHSDVVGEKTKGKEVFSYRHLGTDNAVGGTGGAADVTRYLVKTSSLVNVGGSTVDTYTHVDTTASAAPDGADNDNLLDVVGVKAALPSAVKYSHIHFGVWAAIGEPTWRVRRSSPISASVSFRTSPIPA